MSHKLLGILWLSVAAVSLLVLGLRSNLHLETSFLELLPQTLDQQKLDHQNSLEHLHAFDQQMSKRVLYLVHHPEPQKAVAALGKLRAEMGNSGLFRPLEPLMDKSRGEKIFQDFFHKRYLLPNPEIEKALQHDLLTQKRESIYSGFSPMMAFEQDPLLIFQSLLESWTLRQDNVFVEEGYLALEVEEKVYYLLSAETHESPFSRNAADKAVEFLKELEAGLSNAYPSLQLHHTGVLFFSHAQSSEIEHEITLISTLSFAVVSLLIWLVFSSLKPMLHTLLAITSGLGTAFITTLAYFGEIHLVTLGFGATLIGISVDYAFHYLVGHQPERMDNHKLFRSISLGLLTSILSFSVFSLAPIIVLKQMAIFIIMGLSAAFSYVYIFFPAIDFKHLQHPRFLKISTLFAVGLTQLYLLRKISILLGLGLLLGATIWLRFHFNFNDDLRSLGNPETQMLEKDQWIRKLRGELDPNRSIIVQADSIEGLLQKEEQLRQQLSNIPESQEQNRKIISLSQTLPSQQKQEQMRKVWLEWFSANEVQFKAYLKEFGFNESFYAKELIQLQKAETLRFEDWKNSPLASATQHLLLEKDSTFYSLFLIGGYPVSYLEKVCRQIKGVHYIDRVQTYSDSLNYFRRLTLKWLGIIYTLIAFLCFYFLKVKKALLLLLPPSLGVCLSMLILNSSLSDGLNLFHLIASLLVWGIGMDYAILMQQHSRSEPKVLLANACSALTTVCSFGFLAISQSPVLSAFGSTILIGVMISFVSSSLVFSNSQCAENQTDSSLFQLDPSKKQ